MSLKGVSLIRIGYNPHTSTGEVEDQYNIDNNQLMSTYATTEEVEDPYNIDLNQSF